MFPILVTAAVIIHNGKVLLTKRKADVPYPLLWEFPGGKIEPGEDPRDCIVREIMEELAIEVAVSGMYEVVYHKYPERPVLVLAYRCQWLDGEITDLDVAEHCWTRPCDLMRFQLLPADIPLAEKICGEFAGADITRL